MKLNLRPYYLIIIYSALLLSVRFVDAKTITLTTEGACAIAGLTGEEAQRIAVRRARATAIERAAGLNVTATALVLNGSLTGEFIKSFSRGFIVNETVRWMPVSQYQPNQNKPPLVEYRVKLQATVEVPKGKRPNLGLSGTLNKNIFQALKDPLLLTVQTTQEASIAVFNITADDQVLMLYPNEMTSELIVDGKQILPPRSASVDIYLDTLPGHKKDVEAILIAAAPIASPIRWEKVFNTQAPMTLTSFFRQYAEFAENCSEYILPYEVIKID